MTFPNLFTRDEVLDGMSSGRVTRQASTALRLIETRTAQAVARDQDTPDGPDLREALEAPEDAYLRAFASTRDRTRTKVTLQQIEQYAGAWVDVTPILPEMRAVLANLIAEKYSVTRQATPSIRAALGLETTPVQDAYQARYGRPLDTIFDVVRTAFRDGEVVPVGGNSPLLLSEPGAVWMVDTGSVHVFVVPLRDGRPAGTRTYLFSLQPGDLALSTEVDPITADAALLVAGVPGSQLRQASQERLSGLLSAIDTTDEATTRLRTWVEKVESAVRPGLPPQQNERLLPGLVATLEDGSQGRPLDELVWVRRQDGRTGGEVNLWGRDQIGLPPNGTWFPLTGGSWLTAVGPTTLTVAGTTHVVAGDGLWPALRAFHEAALASARLTADEATRSETDRLQRKVASDQRAMDQAFAELVNEFEPVIAAPLVGGDSDDALLAAARLVGVATGIEIRRPPKSTAQQQGDRLFAIASASRIRMRKVALRGQWWQTESVPMLASLVADDSPVALVPDSARGYVLVNPVDGSRTAVTSAVADTLASFAHVFYRPLPEKRLGVMDLLRFGLRQTGVDFRTVLLMGSLGGALSLLTPVVTGILFDDVIPSAQRSQVVIIALALVVSAVSAALFQLTLGMALLRIETKMGTATQAGVWDRLLNLPIPFFHQYTAGDLQMRVMGIDMIRQILGGVVITSMLTALFSLFSFALLFYYSIKLALLATGLVAIIIGITFAFNWMQLRQQRQIMAYQGALNGMVVQFITGISKLRVAAAENRAFLVWAKAFARQTEVTSKVRISTVHLSTVQSITPVMSTMVIFAVLAYGGASLSIGNFLAFNSAFGQFLAAMLAFSSSFVSLLQIIPIFERAKPILAAEPEVATVKADPGILTGDIEINHLSFRYRADGPLILNDISIHVKPGEFIALVGPSGSGKSTVMRLLMGFEEPTSGAIYYDHQDLADLDVRSIRRQVGVVLQHSQLMPGDIQTNILGNSGYVIDDAWEAARMAGFEEDIKSMPMGMFTVVSEGMSTLSGGQRQRLMIARALVSKPRVVFFDEATSALDNHTQATVSRSLGALQSTRIVIAHRLSTIRKADRIYVIQAGRVVQVGNYDELIAVSGPFRELARRQLA